MFRPTLVEDQLEHYHLHPEPFAGTPKATDILREEKDSGELQYGIVYF